MKNSFNHLLMLSFLWLFGCQFHNHDAQLLSEAEKLSDSFPTQALFKLQQVKSAEKMKAPHRANYNFVLIKSLIYSRSTLPSDSLINQTMAYYQSVNDSIKTETLWYFKGVSLFLNGKYDSAITCFEEAQASMSDTNYSKKIQFSNWIGHSYLNLNRIEQAIEHSQKSLQYAYLLNDTVKITYALMNLANLQKQNKKPDIFLQNCILALELSRKIENKELETNILNTLSDYYVSVNDPKRALYYLDTAKKIRNSRREIPALNLNKAILFHKQNMSDSAYFYAQLAMKGNDDYVSDLAYSLLGVLNEEKGRYIESLNNLKNQEKMQDFFYHGIESGNAQKKYEQEKLKNENNQLKIKKKEQEVISLTISTLALLLLIVFYIIWLRNKRKREQSEHESKTQQLQQENLLLKQQQEISALREKEALLRESLFKRINFFNKFPSLSSEENGSGVHRKIRFTSEEWKELTENIQDAYPRFLDTLKQRAPLLSEDEIRFCCLLKINVNMQDLSDIYCVSKAAITKRKYRLKTEKFNAPDNSINLDTILQNI